MEWTPCIVLGVQALFAILEERQALAIHCPYCKGEIVERENLIRCSQCSTLHHETCWRENGRCSVFACSGVSMPFEKANA